MERRRRDRASRSLLEMIVRLEWRCICQMVGPLRVLNLASRLLYCSVNLLHLRFDVEGNGHAVTLHGFHNKLPCLEREILVGKH
jgi:hypothetical protein